MRWPSHVNITRRRLAEQELARRAAADPLTGLANPGLLRIRLSAALARHPDLAASLRVGLLYLDVDQLPVINDSYGHDAGDEVLLTIGHRLRSQVRAHDTVARLGGGEFAVIAPADQRGRAGRAALPGRRRARPAASDPRPPGPGSGPGRCASGRAG